MKIMYIGSFPITIHQIKFSRNHISLMLAISDNSPNKFYGYDCLRVLRKGITQKNLVKVCHLPVKLQKRNIYKLIL